MLHALAIAASLQFAAVPADAPSRTEARAAADTAAVSEADHLFIEQYTEPQAVTTSGSKSQVGRWVPSPGAALLISDSVRSNTADGVSVADAGVATIDSLPDAALAPELTAMTATTEVISEGPEFDFRVPAVSELPVNRFAEAWPQFDEVIIRGQSTYDEDPSAGANLAQPEYLTLPPDQQAAPWHSQGQVWGGSPLPPVMSAPQAGAPIASTWGANGAQPFRFGWNFKSDVGYLPKERTSNGSQFGVFEFNTEARYVMPTPGQWVFEIAPQFGLRSWDGPARPNLPGEVFRFGGDVRLTTPTVGAYSVQLGFNPSIGTDFDRGLSRDAWMFDGYGALIVRPSARYQLLLGAMYWDRVNDYVLPYAGIIFNPNDVLEVRATFPRADVNLFLGRWGLQKWLYVAGEYHIESYQVTRTSATVPQDKIELEDWRVLAGIRSDTNGFQTFLEAGWVFGRHVEFQNATPGFDISSGFIARFGLKF